MGHLRASRPQILYHLLNRFDGCVTNNVADRDDWLTGCEEQSNVYWLLHEQMVLLDISGQ